MIRYVALICLFAALVKGQGTQVSQCTANGGDMPIFTSIEGCTTPPCRLPQQQDAIIDLVFRAPHAVTEMRTLATAYLLFLPIPFDLQENSLTCNFLTNTQCPVSAGEEINYRLRMYIEPFFPVGTSVTIEFRVVDDNNLPIVCIRVPISITAPLAGRDAIRNNNTTLAINV